MNFSHDMLLSVAKSIVSAEHDNDGSQWSRLTAPVRQGYIDVARAALTAALPHLTQGVGVKKLAWRDHAHGSRCVSDQRYDISIWVEGGKPLYVDNYTTMRRSGTLDEAKAAAQADYEARILSALEPSAARELALEPDFWAIHSKTGVHVGLWPNKAHAVEALREYDGGTITPLYRTTHEHQEGFRQGIEAAAQMADYFEETIYSEGMSEDVYYGISCTVSQIAREIRALSSPDHADAGKVEGDGWLPIESAPKDGTEIIARRSNRFKAFSCFFCHGEWLHYDHEDGLISYRPTEWKPFPQSSAPASEGAE